MTWLPRILLVLVGGIGALAFAPWNLWPLMPLSLAAMIWWLGRADSRKAAFGTGWWWGLGNFIIGQYWIAHAFEFQANMPAWTGWIAVVLLSMIMALYPGVTAAISSRFHARAARALAFGGAWILTEWLRGYLFSGFGWNPLGIVTMEAGPVAQSAALIGALGLSGVAALFAYGLAEAARRNLRLAAALLSPAIILSGAGLVLTGPTRLTDTRVDIVQANLKQDQKYGPGATDAAIRRYTAFSPPPSASPRLLIWPEAAIPEVIDELPGLRAEVAGAVLGPNDLFLVGAVKAIRGPDGRTEAAYNSLFALGPGGEMLDRYDKVRLVPYGEYLPMRSLLEPLGLAQLAPSDLDFWPGAGQRTLRLPGFPNVTALICYEAVYPELAKSSPRPEWLLNVSNDAWFSDEGAAMHLQHARIRSIEQGLPMARSTPTGTSAIIDAYGRVLDSLGRDRAGALSGRLPAARPATLFSHIGSILPLAIGILLIIAAFIVSAGGIGSVHAHSPSLQRRGNRMASSPGTPTRRS